MMVGIMTKLNHTVIMNNKFKLDCREFCPYCKNKDTSRIVDKYEIKDYEQYYSGNKFKVYICHVCTSRWHFMVD